MAARATGSGVISFGMVSIPVKLYSTVDTTKAIRFNMLCKDGARLKQQYISATDGEIVEKEDRVKGYEFAKGQLRHQEEMRPFSEVEIPNADIDDAELKLAIQLIDQVSAEKFEPENYTDEVRHHMLEVIEQKVNGEEIVVAQEEREEAKIIDIMEALKASLKESGSGKKAAKAAAKKKPAKRAPAKKARASKKSSKK